MTQHVPSPSIWSAARRPRPKQAAEPSNSLTSLTAASDEATPNEPISEDLRSDFQHDYDRLLFSTPVRRLADKTQVWPMDENDSVRTRLTHSHEVANLARSIGARVYKIRKSEFDNSGVGTEALLNAILPILEATGLGHDLGNPPFGHQGETAIGRWFECRKDWIFSKTKQDGVDLNASQMVPDALHSEFTRFDGNPQALRLLTRLQTHVDRVGLDLSAATLAAGLKYPVGFDNTDKNDPIKKKGGYFSSEKDVVDWIREQTGLDEGQRHPLTWIMEACDDIAYSVLDVDDVLKKEEMSPDDVLIVLRRDIAENATVKKLHDRFSIVEQKDLRPDAQRDIKIQYLRAFFIEALVTHASEQFINNSSAIFDFSYKIPLMDNSKLCRALKKIARTYAFNNPLVLKTEALGAAALDGLMSAFWSAISERENTDDIESNKLSARSSYIFSLISPNYVQQANPEGASGSGANGVRYREPRFLTDIVSGMKDCIFSMISPNHVQQANPERASGSGANGLRYRELRLLTDMVSGMTDTYAMRLWNEIQHLPYANSAQ